MQPLLPVSLHPFIEVHEDETFEAQLAGLRFHLQELVHFLGDPQLQSNGDLLHSYPARTIGEKAVRVKN
jgi:hypothetical protein